MPTAMLIVLQDNFKRRDSHDAQIMHLRNDPVKSVLLYKFSQCQVTSHLVITGRKVQNTKITSSCLKS